MDAASIPQKNTPEFKKLLEEHPPGSLAKEMTPHLTVKTSAGDYAPIETIKPTTLSDITTGLQDAATAKVDGVLEAATAPLTSAADAVTDSVKAVTAPLTSAADAVTDSVTAPLTSAATSASSKLEDAVDAAAAPTVLPVPAKTARARSFGARHTRKSSRNRR